MKEKIINILEDIQPEVDYETCTDLIDGFYLSSLDIIALVAELEEEYGIIIPPTDIVADNFNSVNQICLMVSRLQEE